MSTKMVLIPLERLRLLEASSSKISDTTPPETTVSTTPQSSRSKLQPDVEMKFITDRKIRKPPQKRSKEKQPLVMQPQQQSLPSTRIYRGKTKQRAKAFAKHVDKFNDRIQFDNGTLKFDGIRVGNSDMDDLTDALVSDKDSPHTAGWDTLMRALEATGAPADLHPRWRKRHKKGDWSTLSN